MRLIALFGPKRSGKDEAARALLGEYIGHDAGSVNRLREVWPIAFADPLRLACDGLGLPAEATRSRKDEPCAELGGMWAGRDALIAIGEAIRALAPDYFARHAIARARDLGGLVVITDGRRVNEARAVREAGGVCAWIHRPSAHERRHEDAVLEAEAHGLCHFEIQNTGDLDHLRAECRKLLDFALSLPEVTP